jgi:hypothetical protein
MTKYLSAGNYAIEYDSSILRKLEFAVGSCGLSRRQALIELGFPEENMEVDKLMRERDLEDYDRSTKNYK